MDMLYLWSRCPGRIPMSPKSFIHGSQALRDDTKQEEEAAEAKRRRQGRERLRERAMLKIKRHCS